VPFARSLAGSVLSLQETSVMNRPDEAAGSGVASAPRAFELQPFERAGRQTLLAAPVNVAAGVQVVLELFDKPAPGSPRTDQRLVTAAADFGAEIAAAGPWRSGRRGRCCSTRWRRRCGRATR